MKLTDLEAGLLVDWFEEHKRNLPWRNTGNPYDVWLSEIMLQQTRVEFVRDRFLAFRKEIPDIPSLASIEDERLMKLWEGMGYYSRARNLKKCAQVLCAQHGGTLPQDPKALRSLPGIGPYTAGAIASLAYGVPVPAVDGNVLRVMARLSGEENDIRLPAVRNRFEQELSEFFRSSEKAQSGTFVSSFNQGLMELGALVCVPSGVPHCEECPWKAFCRAHLENRTDSIPFRSALKKRRIEKRTLLIIRDGNRFVLRKRPDKGLLAGLYEWIGEEGFLNAKQTAAAVRRLGFSPLRIVPLPSSRHIFSHVEWHMKAFEIRVDNLSDSPSPELLLVTKKELQKLAVPSAFHAYKEYYALND